MNGARTINCSAEVTILAQAIKATFARLKTALSESVSTALSDEFAQNTGRVALWKGFIARNTLKTCGVDQAQVIIVLRGFLLPPLAATAGENYLDSLGLLEVLGGEVGCVPSGIVEERR